MNAVLYALLWVIIIKLVFSFLGPVMRKIQAKRENQQIEK